ncbi:hypothetical protein ACFXCZ_04600 [Streptomyces sp. NPDC059396]|uniref:hypothetical protein n=1 Tax=Streptomyces sp. NPDC059396 TaxID=3346819 RepID=UPI0036A9AB8E
MTDSTSIAARRFSDMHPGFELVHAEEAAVPVSWLTLELLAQERRPLPVVDEFVLRLTNRGIDQVAAIASVLGLDDEAVQAAVAQQLSAETVDYRPDRRGGRMVVLTPAGKRAVTDLSTTTPQRVEQPQSFDRLLWEPTSHTSSELINNADTKQQNLITLPSRRTYDVTTDDITARALNHLLERQSRSQETSVEILTVEGIIRQPRRYLPAVLLVFSATGFDDVRLSVIIDDSASEAHDTALNELGGAEQLKIRVEPSIGEPDLPPELQALRASHSTVRALQRRADTATSPDEAAGEHAGSRAPDDSVTARAELDGLTVRSIPVFEYREQLTGALENATYRFLLAAPSVSASVVTDEMVHRLETMLRRRGLLAHIAYGLGQPDSQLDSVAITRLETLARRYDNFTLSHLTERLPGILIFDDTWVNSNFNWLSYRGAATRIYRKAEGTLVRSKEFADDKHAQYVRLIEPS